MELAIHAVCHRCDHEGRCWAYRDGKVWLCLNCIIELVKLALRVK